MAERIAALPTGRGESRAIDESWLDGSPWKLYRGTDYETLRCRVALFPRSARGTKYAPSRGFGEWARLVSNQRPLACEAKLLDASQAAEVPQTSP